MQITGMPCVTYLENSSWLFCTQSLALASVLAPDQPLVRTLHHLDCLSENGNGVLTSLVLLCAYIKGQNTILVKCPNTFFQGKVRETTSETCLPAEQHFAPHSVLRCQGNRDTWSQLWSPAVQGQNWQSSTHPFQQPSLTPEQPASTAIFTYSISTFFVHVSFEAEGNIDTEITCLGMLLL